jgi:hypothetical protein
LTLFTGAAGDHHFSGRTDLGFFAFCILNYWTVLEENQKVFSTENKGAIKLSPD